MRLLGSLLGCGTRPGTKKVASTPTTSPSDDGVDSIDDWELKERCISVFYKADADSDGFLSLEELGSTMKKPQFAESALESYDRDKDGRVSLAEWCATHKELFDKSPAAARTSLKGCEAMLAAREPMPDETQAAPPMAC